MGLSRIVVVVLGSLGMFTLMGLISVQELQLKLWKVIIINFLLTVSGVAGAMLMYRIENGFFGGTSFFGAILFVPVFMLPTLLLKIQFGTIMDLCAPAECILCWQF